MSQRVVKAAMTFLSAGFLAGGAVLAPGTAASNSQPGATTAVTHPRVSAELTPSAQKYYRLFWGVDMLEVKPVSSGAMIRFSYRVVDANKAKMLNDKEAAPQLIDQKTRASLVVPSMEKIGQLRQSSAPEIGREYWMLFSNKGSLVQPGSRVDVVIGRFRAEGLIVRPE